VAAVALFAVAGSLLSAAPRPVDPDLAAARQRAVIVNGSICGTAGPSSGSGIAVGDDRVLTAAHVVASADRLEIVHDGLRVPATIVAFDRTRDLALLRPDTPLPAVPDGPVFGAAAVDDDLTVVGGVTSGDVRATVSLVTVIETDEVRGTARVTRDGYLLAAATKPGDSGAGVYDEQGRLTALAFAVSTNDAERTWATAASEIEAFLAEDPPDTTFNCDRQRSKVVDGG
jgi:S1-C subfamily serine protease